MTMTKCYASNDSKGFLQTNDAFTDVVLYILGWWEGAEKYNKHLFTPRNAKLIE